MTSNRTVPYSPTARQARRRSGLRKNGATFVGSQQAGASMAMAVLTGGTLLACLATALMAARPAVVILGEPCE